MTRILAWKPWGTYGSFVVCMLLAMLMNFGCSHGTDVPGQSGLVIHEVPVITGVYVTDEPNPDGTGEVVGSPSYTINPGANAWPNPFTGKPSHTLLEGEIIYYPRVIKFSHLEHATTIEIVQGRLGSSPQIGGGTGGGLLGPPQIPVLRTLTNGEEMTQFINWDLKDENGQYVQPGAYRAFYHTKEAPTYRWVDVIVSVDPATVRYQK